MVDIREREIYLKQAIKTFKQNIREDLELKTITLGQFNHLLHEIDDKNNSLDYKYDILMCYYVTVYQKRKNNSTNIDEQTIYELEESFNKLKDIIDFILKDKKEILK